MNPACWHRRADLLRKLLNPTSARSRRRLHVTFFITQLVSRFFCCFYILKRSAPSGLSGCDLLLFQLFHVFCHFFLIENNGVVFCILKTLQIFTALFTFHSASCVHFRTSCAHHPKVCFLLAISAIFLLLSATVLIIFLLLFDFYANLGFFLSCFLTVFSSFQLLPQNATFLYFFFIFLPVWAFYTLLSFLLNPSF